MASYLYALFDSTMMGLHVAQYWADIALWEHFLNEHPDIQSIVELGAYKCGMSVYLLGNALTRGQHFWTFDKDMPDELHGPLAKRLQLDRHFVHGDFFRDTRWRLEAILENDQMHPLVLFVDGGNKPLEFATFVPMLREGDYVAVHDYGTEYRPDALEPMGQFIEPIFVDECNLHRPCITRFWRRNAVSPDVVGLPAMINDQPLRPPPEKPSVPTEWMEKTPEERGFWLVATGTGRCGTGYLSKVLASVGVKCSHEGMFCPADNKRPSDGEIRARIKVRHDNAWWGWEAESSWLAAPYLRWPEMAGKQVVHLVRDPVAVINSQMRIRAFDQQTAYLEHIVHWLPGMAEWETPEHKAAYFYVAWNELIEPFATVCHRIEDDVVVLLEQLSIFPEGNVYDNKSYNSRVGLQQWDFQFKNLPDELRIPLLHMQERYGYG